ncbi:MAG: class I SAM-dependent rRNA methyltransferase [Polyangiaceae bacterium]
MVRHAKPKPAERAFDKPSPRRPPKPTTAPREQPSPRRPPKPAMPPREQPVRPLAGAEGLPVVSLPAHLAESLSQGHPWVYRDHVPPGFSAENGSFVQLRAGGLNAIALWDDSSPIALRVFSRVAVPDAAWVSTRVEQALALRRDLRERDTTAFRLLYGEGDGVPGLTVDVYDRYAVIVTYASALGRIVPWVVEALSRALPLDGVLQRRRTRDEEERVVVLRGSAPDGPVLVREYGVRFLADLRAGQKTGLFLDHRDNRAWLREHARGLSVLNLFSYTGGFSVCAALGGAKHVVSVDIAPQAVAAARQNFAENQLPEELHEAVASDVFEYLEQCKAAQRRFDCIVCDPPSFAPSRDKQYAALRAYTRLNALGMSVVTPGGFYAAASCTAQVSPEAFRGTLAEAAERARVRFQIIHDVGQPSDHPVFAGHPEGRYLKFVVGRVLARY